MASSIPGRDVVRRIRGDIRRLEATHKKLTAQMGKASSQLEQATAQRDQAFARLAEIYLPELDDAGSHVLRRELPRMHQRIEEALQDLTREREQLDRRLRESEEMRLRLEDELTELTARIEAKADEREALLQKLEDEVTALPGYATLLADTEQAKERLLQAERRLEAAEQERQEKLPAFEDSDLFRYLLDRKYGTAEYTSGGLTRRLDDWVAGVVSFRDQIESYRILKEVPDVMAAEAERARSEAQEKGQALETMRGEVSARIGLSRVLEEGEALYQQRVALVDRIETLDAAYEADVARRQAADDSRGRHYKEVLGEYKRFLMNQPAGRLRHLAADTTTRSDDGLVAQIDDLEEAARDSESIQRTSQAERDTTVDRIRGLRHLDNAVHRRDWDASNSFFRRELSLDKLLDGFLAGSVDVASVLKRLAQHQGFRRRSQGAGSIILGELLEAAIRSGVGSSVGRSGRGRPRRSGRSSRRSRGGGFGGFGGMSRSSGGFGGGSSRTTGGFG